MTQTFELRKLNLIERLVRLKDENLFALIERLLDSGDDWAEHLSDRDRTDIEAGLQDLDSGRTEPLSDFNERMRQKYR
jgi:hypothetical protein